MAKTFTEKVYEVVKKIPGGKTLSYKEVAKKAGSEKAFRAVGNILNKNFNPLVPCHRVIKSNGQLGGYNRGSKNKQKILLKEGFLKWYNLRMKNFVIIAILIIAAVFLYTFMNKGEEFKVEDVMIDREESMN